MSNTSSANPEALCQYARVATALDDGLLAEARHLRAALDDFPATCTEYDTGVSTALADDLERYARDARRTDEWVGRVGQAFLQADQHSYRSGFSDPGLLSDPNGASGDDDQDAFSTDTHDPYRSFLHLVAWTTRNPNQDTDDVHRLRHIFDQYPQYAANFNPLVDADLQQVLQQDAPEVDAYMAASWIGGVLGIWQLEHPKQSTDAATGLGLAGAGFGRMAVDNMQFGPFDDAGGGGGSSYGTGKPGVGPAASEGVEGIVEGTVSSPSKRTITVIVEGTISSPSKRTITVIERDGDIVILRGSGPKGDFDIVTEMTKEGDTLILNGTHIAGEGADTMGLSELREFARTLGRKEGVAKVRIVGGRRTTGANPGRLPRPIEVEVD